VAEGRRSRRQPPCVRSPPLKVPGQATLPGPPTQFFALKGPSGSISHCWMSRALQSFMSMSPKMDAGASSTPMLPPSSLPVPITQACPGGKGMGKNKGGRLAFSSAPPAACGRLRAHQRWRSARREVPSQGAPPLTTSSSKSARVQGCITGSPLAADSTWPLAPRRRARREARGAPSGEGPCWSWGASLQQPPAAGARGTHRRGRDRGGGRPGRGQTHLGRRTGVPETTREEARPW
jgi:hypothetical protein